MTPWVVPRPALHWPAEDSALFTPPVVPRDQLKQMEPLLTQIHDELTAPDAYVTLPAPPPAPFIPALSGFPEKKLSGADRLADYVSLAQANILVERFFPRRAAEASPEGCDWQRVLAGFLGLVEGSDWFPIDWDLIASLDTPRPFIKTIPLKTFGLTDTTILRYPPLHVLDLLLNPRRHTDDRNFQRYGITPLPPQVHAIPGKVNLRRALTEATFDEYTYPFDLLGSVLTVMLGWSPNLFITTPEDWFFDGDGDEQFMFVWSSPAAIEQLRAAWRAIAPIIRGYQAFLQWTDRYYPPGSPPLYLNELIKTVLSKGGFL